ncbi:hypothetical protein [Vallitalea okinawensis]|uniref:hypothetical protein n=1 Tax=Vallitalea okinawensis TaxID=2078660 RepID=UPI000CFB3C8E|nr:hypothetical protein [Vallitalea okinawensis]
MSRFQTDITEMDKELDRMKFWASSTLRNLHKSNNAMIHRFQRYEWHLHGLVYHMKNLITYYSDIGEQVRLRINSGEDIPAIIILNCESGQKLYYEFYSFVNLTKITLDNLSKMVYPLFENKDLPNSFSKYNAGTTNCPLYEWLSNTDLIYYFIDIRNLLVHFKSFATTDNIVVLKDDLLDEINNATNDIESYKFYTECMLKSYYRIQDKRLVFNIKIPDSIFEGAHDKICKFEYYENKNIIAESMKLTRVIFQTVSFIRDYYSSERKPEFKYHKKGEFKVRYPIFNYNNDEAKI